MSFLEYPSVHTSGADDYLGLLQEPERGTEMLVNPFKLSLNGSGILVEHKYQHTGTMKMD